MAPRSPLQPQPRAERTRAAILQAGEAVFAANGFAAARLEDVARRVGIRRPSIIYHFRDKRELYEAVLEDVFGDLLRRFEAVRATRTSLAERLEAMVLAWVRYVGERPSVARILLREVAEASDARSPAAARHVRPVIRAVADVITAGQRAGAFETIDPIHFIFTIAGATVFFVAAAPALAPEWPFDPLSPAQLASHEAEALQITRRLLGTRGPRAAPRRRGRPAKAR